MTHLSRTPAPGVIAKCKKCNTRQQAFSGGWREAQQFSSLGREQVWLGASDLACPGLGSEGERGRSTDAACTGCTSRQLSIAPRPCL